MSEGAAEQVDSVRQRWGVPRCGYYANAGMLWVGSRVLWLGYFFVWFAALYFFFIPKARRASMAFLDRIQPGRGAMQRSSDTYRHMVQYGFLLLDRAVMLTSARHGFAITCDGLAHLTKAVQSSSGTIMLTAHFGNAEVAAPYIFRIGVNSPIHIVMYQDSADATERFHTKYRRLMANMRVISTTDPLAAGVKIIKALREGGVVAMRADRAMKGKTVSARLLDVQVELPAGPFVAAALSGVPVVHVHTVRLGYRRYLCMISPTRSYGDGQPGTRDERIARAAQDFADHLERVVRKYPLQWGNFYDLWTEQRTVKELHVSASSEMTTS